MICYPTFCSDVGVWSRSFLFSALPSGSSPRSVQSMIPLFSSTSESTGSGYPASTVSMSLRVEAAASVRSRATRKRSISKRMQQAQGRRPANRRRDVCFRNTVQMGIYEEKRTRNMLTSGHWWRGIRKARNPSTFLSVPQPCFRRHPRSPIPDMNLLTLCARLSCIVPLRPYAAARTAGRCYRSSHSALRVPKAEVSMLWIVQNVASAVQWSRTLQ